MSGGDVSGKGGGAAGSPLPQVGGRRGRRRPFPRGRQVDEQALAEVRELLGPGERRRDLLIEYLHRIQERFGALAHDHLNALAAELRLAQAEVYEVATFYAHFEVVERLPASRPVTVRVCTSLSCALAGAQALLSSLGARADEEGMRVIPAPCIGRCDTAPAAQVGARAVPGATAESVLELVRAGETEPAPGPWEGLAQYRARGGYRVLDALERGERPVERIIGDVDSGRLRGLGGAGFPTARKWQIVRGYPGPRLMAVNADEGEPGTFKDRFHLERHPHQFLEGMLIAARVVEAEAVYIYLRDEYPEIRRILTRELAALAAERALLPIELRRGAGAYICGEESAMLESIEGRRGLPRHRPPYVAEVGLFGRPTLVQNVETLLWVPALVPGGPEGGPLELAVLPDPGRPAPEGASPGAGGLRSYSVSGRVRNPGVRIVPAGTSARTLIEEHCGGMLPGHTLKGFLPGGASGGILPASMADLPLDFGTLEPHGAFVGSHALIVLSDQDSIREVVLNLMRFFEHESCGQCTPCRVGTEKAVRLLEAQDGKSGQGALDRDLALELADTMGDASICGLGQAAPNPLRCWLRYFPDER